MPVENVISFFGFFVLLAVAWFFSRERRNVNWRVIIWGTVLQFAMAVLIFVFPLGARLFQLVNTLVVALLDSATAGARFVFGPLAIPPGAVSAVQEHSIGFILAFQALPTIIFFSALMSILYYLGIMQRVIKGFAWLFTRLMRISGAESLSAASNIFVGVESALTVCPYLDKMTRSELCTLLTAGMATVSSNVLAVYVFSLQQQLPAIAGHLVTASLLSAPAAVMVSKIILPESDRPETLGRVAEPHYDRENSLFEAIINGAGSGVKLIVGIVALLLAVLGLVALVDLILGWGGGPINSLFSIHIDWSLKGLLGYVFYPFTLLLGIPTQDATLAAQIIGERAIVTELTSYQDLSAAMAAGLFHNPRSAVVITYALCGFAHVASVAIFVGGISALVPKRTREIASVGWRALLAATIACLLTACVAGTFFGPNSLSMF